MPGRRVLVVEDDFHVAESLAMAFAAHGCEVVGPVATVEAALALIVAGGPIDGAVLDINLRGELAYPVADALRARRVPFVFTTGYDEQVVAEPYGGIACFEKPVLPGRVLEALFG
jgi:DNA-binding response OmpR family regulator